MQFGATRHGSSCLMYVFLQPTSPDSLLAARLCFLHADAMWPAGCCQGKAGHLERVDQELMKRLLTTILATTDSATPPAPEAPGVQDNVAGALPSPTKYFIQS